jgi:hypothetical protein
MIKKRDELICNQKSRFITYRNFINQSYGCIIKKAVIQVTVLKIVTQVTAMLKVSEFYYELMFLWKHQ